MDLNLLIEKTNSDGTFKVKQNFNIERLEFYKRNGLHWISNTINIKNDKFIIKPSEFYKIDDTPFEIRKGKLVTI